MKSKLSRYVLSSASWILLASCLLPLIEAAIDASVICNFMPGLSPHQRLLCRTYPDAMVAIGDGARIALGECQFQFRFSRWNCSLGGNEEQERGVSAETVLQNVSSVGK